MNLIKLIISLGLDSSDLKSNLKDAENSVSNFARSTGVAVKSQLGSMFAFGAISSLPSLAVSALKRISTDVIETGRHIQSLANQSKMSTDEVQKLMVVGQQNNISAEQYLHVFSRIAEARAKALAGDPTDKLRFERFGVSQNDLKSNLTNLQIAIRLGDEMERQKGSVNAEADMLHLTGIRYYRLLNTLKEINSVKNDLIIDSNTIDQLNLLAKTWIAVGVRLTAAFAPMIGQAGQMILSFIGTDEHWSRARHLREDTLARNPKASNSLVDYYNIIRKIDDRTPLPLPPKKGSKDAIASKEIRDRATADELVAKEKLREKIEAIKDHEFKSSADKKVSEIGGFYLGAKGTAEEDMARQRTEHLKQISEITKEHLRLMSELNAQVAGFMRN